MLKKHRRKPPRRYCTSLLTMTAPQICGLRSVTAAHVILRLAIGNYAPRISESYARVLVIACWRCDGGGEGSAGQMTDADRW